MKTQINRKIALLLAIVFFSTIVFSQSTSKTYPSLDIITMTKVLNNNNLSNDLKHSSSFRFSQPLNYVGLTLTGGFVINDRVSTKGAYYVDGYIEYLQVIPQRIMVMDSIEGKINGFNLGLSLAGIDLLKNKKVDLIACLGFNTGRVWLNGPEMIKQKKTYFAPMLTIVSRVYLGNLSLQLRCGYDYDISNKNWKRKGFGDAELMELNKLSFQGLNISLGIGYIIGKQQ